MSEKKDKEFLTVAPFECAWRQDLRFSEAGRGCIAFEAFARNDVTVVFRECVGSQHYHYKRDNSPHYTVILGSHRNKRLRIEVNGKTVVDEAGIGLCCCSVFQSYWISVYDGLISIGKGRYPFQNLLLRWLDSNPNCSVQYIGLSSWDRHVGYRNVTVLPLIHNHISLWKQLDYAEYAGESGGNDQSEDGGFDYEKWGLKNFLESWDLSDMLFLVGQEERHVPAHKVILEAAGNFHLSLSNDDVIQLACVTYPVLHALLQYIYTGRTQITESQLGPLTALSIQFEVVPLVKQCKELIKCFKQNKKLFDSGKNIEISYPGLRSHCSSVFPSGYPIDTWKLRHMYATGRYSNLDIYIESHGLVSKAHKIILSLWSIIFTKMFTNGMRESISSTVCFKDVSPEAFKVLVEFMYGGELVKEDTIDINALLIQLLLSDQFEVIALHEECCKMLLESLSKDTVCSALRVVSSIPPCELIEETCKRIFSVHFDYCTTARNDFILLDEATFSSIIKHPDLTVTSEERILDAILLWCIQAKEICGWETVNELMKDSHPERLFGKRLQSLDNLLLFVRFSLMPYESLKKLEESNLCVQMPTFRHLVKESIAHVESGPGKEGGNDSYLMFQHRRTSFKELRYISDGDRNGVMYFSGTAYGKHQWVNPVLAKRITITASSPFSRYTDPKVLVSRSYQGTSFAGPSMEDGKNCAWWMVDIGQDHQLMCNYYTLRLDGSRSYMRSWRLQGSTEGKNWTNLRVHEDDKTMCRPGQFSSWPVAGPNALLPFRFFRVVLTGPPTDGSNTGNLSICFWELYGYFH